MTRNVLDFAERSAAVALATHQAQTLPDEEKLVETKMNLERIMTQYCKITFLPSEYGDGYRASFSGRVGDECKWADSGYANLKGVAVLPSPDDTSDHAWLEFVRNRLAAQGVRFLPPDQASNYIRARSLPPNPPADRIRGIAPGLLALEADRKGTFLASLSTALRALIELEWVRIFHEGKPKFDQYWIDTFRRRRKKNWLTWWRRMVRH